MRKVRLVNAAGAFVVSGRIPVFNEPPAVLIWGTRFFVYSVTDDEQVDVYVEAFTTVLLETD